MGKTIQEVFQSQIDNQWILGNSTLKERKTKLKKLRTAILSTYRQQIRDALYNDFRKPQVEVDLTEIFIVSSEINHTLKHLGSWMANHHVPTPLHLLGSSSWIRYESKGVSLIVSPWNFPLNLTLGPLVSAIAAGCPVILKPSEHTPHISRLMGVIIKELFEENEVALFEGGVDTATELLALPFNHIFFTGSTKVGKIVMKAAAKNLASVTLELGGKSPTIVDETANLSMAARRIAWGKFVNNGQICIAPDYVLVHEKVKDEFQKKIKESLKQFYTERPKQEPSYNRMVNTNHMKRVGTYLDDSVLKGAKVISGGTREEETDNYFSPTLVSEVPVDAQLMTEEIFGPVLPINTFSNLNQAIQFINSKEKPLALYMYSSKKANIKQVLQNTRAGGTCINHNGIHFYNMNLPFGGVNHSGMGRSHGFEGFKSFSNGRAIYKQNFPGALELLTPPYNRFKEKLAEFTVRWF